MLEIDIFEGETISADKMESLGYNHSVSAWGGVEGSTLQIVLLSKPESQVDNLNECWSHYK